MLDRTALRTYADISGTLYPIGDGFTRFAYRQNPVLHTRRYFSDATVHTDVVGYENEITYAHEAVENDPVCVHFAHLTAIAPTGDGACVTLVTTYPDGIAIKQAYTLCPKGCADGADILTYEGTLKAHGMPIIGTFDAQATTFSPACEA